MKRTLRYLLGMGRILVLAMLIPLTLFAQTRKKDNQGKEFYVAFAENHGGQGYQNEDSNFFALYITSKVATTGNVEVTALSYSVNFTTTPGKITTIELPDGKQDGAPTVELTAANGQEEQVVSGMAVHITANDDIAVYGINSKLWSTDAFMALPVTVLGTEYRTMNYQSSSVDDYGFGSDKFTPGEFWIVGVIDSTNVTITPKANTMTGQSAGVPFKVLLQKGDVYLVEGELSDETNDLTGSLIESDQSVAVLSGHVRCEIPHGFDNLDTHRPSRNHVVEQMPPVSAWGDSALVVRYASALLPDLVRVVSSEDNNKITVNGNVVTTLSAGGFYEIFPLTGPTSIQGTSPIMVGQFLHTDEYSTTPPPGKPTRGDPAYALVFPVEQFDTSYTFIEAERNLFTFNYVNIVADPAGIAGMVLDGKPITGPPFNAAFSPIPGSKYVYAQVELDQGTHNIYGTNPFGITVYGLGPADAYAYTGGSLLKTITPFKTVDVIIDFGDRVMTQTGPGPTYAPLGKGTNLWDTTVYLQNISSDPYTIESWAPVGGNIPPPPAQATFSVVSKTPDAIGPGVIDSMTIEFTPAQPGTRFHTTIKAVTEHLRAYVVDVYGRGVLPNVEIYGDSIATYHIDTLDFGVFDAAVDQAKDSFVYLFNKGAADLTVTSDGIAGPNWQDFFIGPNFHGKQFPRMLNSAPVVAPFTLHPYNLLAVKSLGAKIPLQFDPAGLANGFYQAEYDVNTQGQQHKVILLATVHTILKSTVTPATFDTAFLCQTQTRNIVINNPNTFPITIIGISLSGKDSSSFQTFTQVPLTIDAGQSYTMQIQFSPLDTTGMRAALVTIIFDLPKGYTVTVPLSAFADQLSSSFWARTNIHILPGEETTFPIYARSPMQQFNSSTFQLEVWYDTTYIVDEPDGYIQDNTLTSLGYYSVNNDSAGYTIYSFVTSDGSPVSGGSDTTQMPLVYLKFKSHLSTGANRAHFHTDIPINYQITFPKSPVPQGCILSLNPAGMITLDSTCETVYLLYDTLFYPSASYIMPVRPNPVSNYAKFEFDVPSLSTQHLALSTSEDIPVRLDIVDMLGNPVATVIDETKKPGTYEVLWSAAAIRNGSYYARLVANGQAKVQKIVVQH